MVRTGAVEARLGLGDLLKGQVNVVRVAVVGHYAVLSSVL